MRVVLMAVTTVVAAMVTVPGGAAAADTCRGEPATISADGQKLVTGTDGDDVMVVSNFERVEAGDGADLVCVVQPTPGSPEVDAGAGDDVVDTLAGGRKGAIFVNLGAGADQYFGGPNRDIVDAGDRDANAVDVISTGAGLDSVDSGRRRMINQDSIRTGAGHDNVDHVGLPAGQVILGKGSNDLSLTVPGRKELRIDLAAGVIAVDGVETVASGVEDVYLDAYRFSTLTLIGTAADNNLDLATRKARPSGIVDVDLGAGNDSLWQSGLGPVGGSIRLGGGQDSFTLGTDYQYGSGTVPGVVKGSLANGDFSVQGRSVSVTGIDRFWAYLYRSVELRGSGTADRIRVDACRARVDAGAGDDHVAAGNVPRVDCGFVQTTHLSGQDGADRLVGTHRPDVLIGGPGGDFARGRGALGPGSDRCVAEIARC